MANRDKTSLVAALELQPYTEQPAHPPQQPGYAPQSMQQVQQNTTMAVSVDPTVIMEIDPPPTWVYFSIITCLFCAWPIG